MKVALIGNMNNNFFSILRYLRDVNIDAHLFLTNAEQSHFLPECDTFEDKYNNFIHQLNWGHPISYFNTSKNKIREDLKDCSFIICCGFVPAFLKKADLPINIFVPFGGDIWGRPIFESINLKRIFINAGVRWIQKKGVPYAKIVHMTYTNDMYENRLNYLNKNHIRWEEMMPMIYYPDYDKNNLGNLLNISKYGQEFKKLRKENDLLILSHSRHYWHNKSLEDPANKGTDKLIRGYAKLVEKNKDLKVRLIFLEYGHDIEPSKQLIKDLNIENHVVWFPKMKRKDLMAGLMVCDLVCAEFTHSWNTSGVLYEALVGAKPILAHRDEEDSKKQWLELYEIMNAYSEVEIEEQLNNYIKDPNKYKKIGENGRKWFLKQVNVALLKYIDYINKYYTKQSN